MTTVRLNKDINNKLSILIEMEKKSKSEIIKKAILEYFNQHVREKSPYETGRDLFGKYGSENLSSDSYKEKVKEKLREKHSH